MSPSHLYAGKVDVRALRQAFELTQADFARMGAFSTRAVQLWERGDAEPGGTQLKALRELQRLLPEPQRYWKPGTSARG